MCIHVSTLFSYIYFDNLAHCFDDDCTLARMNINEYQKLLKASCAGAIRKSINSLVFTYIDGGIVNQSFCLDSKRG